MNESAKQATALRRWLRARNCAIQYAQPQWDKLIAILDRAAELEAENGRLRKDWKCKLPSRGRAQNSAKGDPR